jgi:hypothetical protein
VGEIPYHHGMARPHVADGGDGLKIWRVAAWELGVGLTTHRKKINLLTKIHKYHQTWTDSLDKQPKRKKMDMDWIDLAQAMDQWGALVNTAKNLRVP